MKRHLLLGYDAALNAVSIDVELRDASAPAPYLTTEHKPLDGRTYTELAISGTVRSTDQRKLRGHGVGVVSCGQTIDALRSLVRYAPGWNRERVERVVAIWERWHLNGMRPGCVHQQNDGAARERPLFVWHLVLTREALAEKSAIEKRAWKALLAGEAVTLSEHERAIGALPYSHTIWTDNDVPPALPLHYKLEDPSIRPNPDRKTAGWVRVDEHPAGMLGKTCPAGYAYGSAWLVELLPPDVVAEVLSWPNGASE